MNDNDRVRRALTLGLTAALATSRVAAQPALVNEADPQAKALGYVSDATKADAKRFPKYAAGQNCANCALYQGKPTDAVAGCPLFAGRQVPAKAWCSAWAKRA